ncbi:MAG: thioester domain-containing protein [Ignavibacteria bacterium]|nr:thioester domain-containing protein [Ignavibacteria bacterium]
MKAIAIVLLIISTCSNAFGQYTSASISGYSFGSTVTYLDPVTGSVDARFVGLLYGRLTDSSTGPIVSYYFLDAFIPSGFSIPRNDYLDDITSDGIEPHACWIINNFYPGKTGTGQLSDLNKETAAIQFAIWHYTFGLQISSISDPIRTLASSKGSSVRLSVEFVMDEDPEFSQSRLLMIMVIRLQ